MSGLAEIRTAIKDTLQAAIPGLKVYDTVEAVNVLPAAVVYPDTIDYLVTFKQGTVTADFDLYVLCPAASEAIGQRRLDSLVDPFAEASIPRVLLDAEGSIGLDDTQCVPMRLSRYGGSFESAGVEHVGAVISLQLIMNRGT